MAYSNTFRNMEDMYAKRSFFYSLPITIGAFFRELLAVTLVLVLTERARTYDFFTPGFVLLLVFLTFRIPNINSYTLLFETFSLGQWQVKNHVGGRNHADISQNILHVMVVLAAHIGGAIGAAAIRVYFDVMYGTEIMFGKNLSPDIRTDLAPALTADVHAIRAIDSFWGSEDRVDRLLKKGVNDTVTELMPLTAESKLGISDTALTVWYTTEEIGFVFLLCVCYIHIWLSSGVGENKKPLMNPFSRVYWKRLFRVCTLVVLIYMALYRAFPTAHGSLHSTIFKVQYQAWNPSVHLIDDDHNETFARIFGGFIGVVLAIGYNKMLVGTERADADDDSGDFYYKLVWGMEADPNHSRARRIGSEDQGESGSDEEKSQGRRKGSRAYKWKYPRNGSVDDSSVGCKTYHIRHCDKGGNCSDSKCTVCQAPDFKLRLPHTLDHAK